MGVVDITCDIGGAFEMLTTSPYYPHNAVLGPHRRGGMFLAPFCGQSAPKVDNMMWLPASAGNHKLMGVVDITCDIGGAFEMLTTSPYYPHDAVLGPHRRGVPGDMGHVFGAILWAVSAKS